ncbi:MAG: hypothetical protein JWQ49_2380 [Edaphobacter sp.]|nr:hypothetical protein [Edaphobacter sp.]
MKETKAADEGRTEEIVFLHVGAYRWLQSLQPEWLTKSLSTPETLTLPTCSPQRTFRHLENAGVTTLDDFSNK